MIMIGTLLLAAALTGQSTNENPAARIVAGAAITAGMDRAGGVERRSTAEAERKQLIAKRKANQAKKIVRTESTIEALRIRAARPQRGGNTSPAFQSKAAVQAALGGLHRPPPTVNVRILPQKP